MILRIVAAIGKNRELGKEGWMPWDLPDDLKHFREITNGKPVIMGRKTFETLQKALPNRMNIVVTRNTKFERKEAVVLNSIEKAIEKGTLENPKEICVIGGGEIYKLALPFATHLSLTLVDGKFDADTFFPEWDESEWKEVSRIHHPKDEDHKYAFDFLEFERA